jgi:hypothetical protein
MAYFHNMIGLLTETIGSHADQHPVHPSKQLPDSNPYFSDRATGWHFRQSIDYSVTANYAVFDIASRNKENFLYNIYQMGKNSIERGNATALDGHAAPGHRGRDGAQRRSRPRRRAVPTGDEPDAGGGRGGRGSGSPEDFKKFLRDPAARDPRVTSRRRTSPTSRRRPSSPTHSPRPA